MDNGRCLIRAKICALMAHILYDLCTKWHSNHITRPKLMLRPYAWVQLIFWRFISGLKDEKSVSWITLILKDQERVKLGNKRIKTHEPWGKARRGYQEFER